MTLHLPKDVERSIAEAVHRGRFASADDAVAIAWRLFEQADQGRQAETTHSIDELNRRLLASGLVSQLPDPAEDLDDSDDSPIDVVGEPVSETIIRERR